MTEDQRMRKCGRCGHDGPHNATLEERGHHYARLTCVVCDCFIAWLPKPDDDSTKYRRPSSHRAMVKKHSRGYCEMCRIVEAEVPKGESLEAHHVIPFDEDGPDTRENTWILCTGCHKLVEWRRTYQKHFLERIGAKLTEWQQS